MKILSIAQIVVSVILVVLILLQERSSGVGGVFGGGTTEVYQKRRGVERLIFAATIILAIAFPILAILNFILIK